jgi:phenylalanyl-tRNA synthetase alpha chain
MFERKIFMKEQLDLIQKSVKDELEKTESQKDIEAVRIKYLGKKGELTGVLKQMGSLSPAERPIYGQLANEVRANIENLIAKKTEAIKAVEMAARLQSETIDITVPGIKQRIGHKHPLSIVLDEVKDIFLGLGFNIVTGPEIEWDYYNFEALNIPKDHPARDTQDTFYITENMLLRTQTSPVQIRVMEQQSPPIKIIAPGRVYRSDAVDATHSPIFHQIEGLVVDKGITMGHLKGCLDAFAKRLYGEDTKIRLRPHHFPFTEPSCEIDVSCFRCGGKGCPMCKGEGWIEILGGGMVHPKVLKNGGIDPEVYSGFAFGVGLERLVMFRFNIDDMRLLYENDLRFLSQF